jgi:hypothetical protein
VMGIELRRRRQGCQIEDHEMEGYAAAYRAYIARRDLPGPWPTFCDFVEICRVRQRNESLIFEGPQDAFAQVMP